MIANLQTVALRKNITKKKKLSRVFNWQKENKAQTDALRIAWKSYVCIAAQLNSSKSAIQDYVSKRKCVVNANDQHVQGS